MPTWLRDEHEATDLGFLPPLTTTLWPVGRSLDSGEKWNLPRVNVAESGSASASSPDCPGPRVMYGS